MAKKKGNPEKSTICCHCGTTCSLEDKRSVYISNYERYTHYQYTSSNHTVKRLLSFSVCMKCYEEVKKFCENFIKFEDGVSTRKGEYLVVEQT